MILKQTISKGRTYWYYVCCGKNQDKKVCPAHRISKAVLAEKVLHQLQSRIGDVMKIDERTSSINISYINEIRKQEIIKELGRLSDELKMNRRYLKRLYEDFAIKILSQSDFEFMRRHYIKKCNVIEETIQTAELNILDNLDAEAILGWIEQYRPFFSFDKITRPMLAYLAQRITVDDKKGVQVEFLHEQEYLLLCDAIKNFLIIIPYQMSGSHYIDNGKLGQEIILARIRS